MKATKIYYKRLFNTGNFSNEEIGIEIEIEKGEKAKDVMQKAKKFVESFDPHNTRKQEDLERILKTPHSYSYGDVENAKKELDKLIKKLQGDDLPF